MIIAATLIARNEARCIARCLDSVRPFVDRMLVLDTGSTDGTPDIAQGSGADVHHLDWPDDFSVARNRALDLADADWNLILDADEWIESGGDGLRAWCEGPPRLGRICVHSAFDDAGNSIGGRISTSRSWITRVLPRGVRFQGRVHEQADSPLPRERLDFHVGHDGYLDAQMAGKRDRNRALLMRDLQDHPDDPYLAFQLGREAEGRDEFAAACEWYEKAFSQASSNVGWFHDLLVRFLHSLGQAGRVVEALRLAETQMPAWEHSPDFFFVVGNLALDRAMEEPVHALDQWLPLAVSCWERCLEIGERPDLEGSVDGRGGRLAQHNLDVVRSQMAPTRL
jgi:glycosyltransferase involved in cell wall biosynthesis